MAQTYFAESDTDGLRAAEHGLRTLSALLG